MPRARVAVGWAPTVSGPSAPLGAGPRRRDPRPRAGRPRPFRPTGSAAAGWAPETAATIHSSSVGSRPPSGQCAQNAAASSRVIPLAARARVAPRRAAPAPERHLERVDAERPRVDGAGATRPSASQSDGPSDERRLRDEDARVGRVASERRLARAGRARAALRSATVHRAPRATKPGPHLALSSVPRRTTPAHDRRPDGEEHERDRHRSRRRLSALTRALTLRRGASACRSRPPRPRARRPRAAGRRPRASR